MWDVHPVLQMGSIYQHVSCFPEQSCFLYPQKDQGIRQVESWSVIKYLTAISSSYGHHTGPQSLHTFNGAKMFPSPEIMSLSYICKKVISLQYKIRSGLSKDRSLKLRCYFYVSLTVVSLNLKKAMCIMKLTLKKSQDLSSILEICPFCRRPVL